MVGKISGNPAAILKKIEGLAKADDGQISAGEQEILNQLKSTFDNIDSPHVRDLISQVAQKMGLAGAQATARMASGSAADGPQGSAAASAGGNNDPLRCNSCGGGGGNSSARGASNNGSALPALGGKGGMMFEDMLAQFLFDVIKEMQAELKKKMAQYKAMSKSGKGGGGGGGAGGAGGADSDSRQLLFEEIKNLMQKMQQMIQSLSNILNTLHNGAMNAIRNIR